MVLWPNWMEMHYFVTSTLTISYRIVNNSGANSKNRKGQTNSCLPLKYKLTLPQSKNALKSVRNKSRQKRRPCIKINA